MNQPDQAPETLDEFAGSLSYGSRSDLSFKFMPRYKGPEVGDVLASILDEVGGVLDTGDPGPLIDRVVELQSAAYRRRDVAERFQYEDAPFARPRASLAETTVGLLTSSGHFVAGDDPRPLGVDGMGQAEAEDRIGEFLREAPVLSEIPFETPPEDLVVRHGGYDVRGTARDHNVALPLQPLATLRETGVIGGLAEPAYSFVGACAQMPLLKQTGPQWVERLSATDIDVLLLVPV